MRLWHGGSGRLSIVDVPARCGISYRVTEEFRRGSPGFCNFSIRFASIRFSGEELLQFREDFLHGRVRLDISEEVFRCGSYRRFLQENRDSIASHKARQQAAFDQERHAGRRAAR